MYMTNDMTSGQDHFSHEFNTPVSTKSLTIISLS